MGRQDACGRQAIAYSDRVRGRRLRDAKSRRKIRRRTGTATNRRAPVALKQAPLASTPPSGARKLQQMDVIQYLTAAKTALEVIKGAVTLLPKGSKSEEAREQIERAEKALKASEGAAAKALGYKICQCTFPPQIMLWKEAERAHVCPNSTCGRKVSKSSSVVRVSRRSSWMG